jgi:hypothetical protein
MARRIHQCSDWDTGLHVPLCPASQSRVHPEPPIAHPHALSTRIGYKAPLETAPSSLFVIDLPLRAKIAPTSGIRGLVSREIWARRGVEPSTPARRAREGVGGRVWGGCAVTVSQAIAQPSSQEAPKNATTEASSESTAPPTPIPRVRRWIAHARRSTTVVIGCIPGARLSAPVLSRPAPASEKHPEAHADHCEDADDPQEAPADRGGTRRGILWCRPRGVHPRRRGYRRARPCA